MNRRNFLAAAALAGSAMTQPLVGFGSNARPVFQHRGYYLCFMRMPTFGLRLWREVLDDAAEDGVNMIILWVAGAFRSRKFPVTWQWAKDHENVKTDFVRQLIAHAHRRGIQVLLGFTPFGYDGVNQYTIQHPELKAVGPDGRPVEEFGIGCWGWNLCPAKSASQHFMREYVREMAFEFYPDADGLFIESSDYAICHCEQCGPKFFDHEFAFVRDISGEVWARKPNAIVVVYPHYFSGAKLRFSFAEATASRQPLDPRWTLFFTPHSAPIEPALIERAGGAWWWNEAPRRFDTAGIRKAILHARSSKCSGYLPSLECYSYVMTKTEWNEPWLVGRRQIPFGFGWMKEDANPYRELPVRAIRLVFRELSTNPDLSDTDLRQRLGWQLFGPSWKEADIDDLFLIFEVLNTDRNWSVPGALTSPGLIRSRSLRGQLNAKKREQLQAQLTRIRSMVTRTQGAKSGGTKELHKIAQWISNQWTPEETLLLKSG